MRPRRTLARASGRAMSARWRRPRPVPRRRTRCPRSGPGCGHHGRRDRCRRRPRGARPARPGRTGPARSAPGRGGGPARPAAAAGGGGGGARRTGSWPPGRPGSPRRVRIRKASRSRVERVGPVQVLDHQQQRGQLGHADQQGQHAVEQLDPLEAVPGRRRRPLVGGQLSGSSRPRLGTAAASGAATGLAWTAAEVAEGVDEGHVGEADVAHLHAGRPAPGRRGPRPGRRARRAAGSC